MLSPFSHVCLFAIPWTIAHQAPLSVGFSRQEYWIGLPCPPPRNLPNPGIEPSSLMSPALAGGFFTTRATWEAPTLNTCMYVCMFHHREKSALVPFIITTVQRLQIKLVDFPFYHSFHKGPIHPAAEFPHKGHKEKGVPFSHSHVSSI